LHAAILPLFVNLYIILYWHRVHPRSRAAGYSDK
jgi:hypothetical protein